MLGRESAGTEWGKKIILKFLLLRHGERLWKRENRFTGWADVDLSEAGRIEAVNAGRLLRDRGTAGQQNLARAAHGNSLRTLVKRLDDPSDADGAELIIPTGMPLPHEFDDALPVLARYCQSAEAGHRMAT